MRFRNYDDALKGFEKIVDKYKWLESGDKGIWWDDDSVDFVVEWTDTVRAMYRVQFSQISDIDTMQVYYCFSCAFWDDVSDCEVWTDDPVDAFYVFTDLVHRFGQRFFIKGNNEELNKWGQEKGRCAKC